jgi:putative flippase GtrA
MTLFADVREMLVDRKRLGPLGRFALDLVKYGAASAAALVLDTGLLLILNSGFGVHYLVASAIGFLSGLALVYWLSVCCVFDDSRVLRPSQEIAGFLVTGLIGLGLTELLMALLVGSFDLSAPLAKIPTVGAVFSFNFLSRRMLLFSTRAT